MVFRLEFLFACCLIFNSILLADDTPKTASVDPGPVSALSPVQAPKTVEELAASAKKSVVVVTFTGRDGAVQGMGSGFILSEDGLIATNLHVIGEARPIRVELHDGRKFPVTAIYATERSQDLAILKIDATKLPSLPLANSDELQEGQAVVAIGNPLGLQRSVVAGVLSGRREIDGRSMLQIALPIERGNSGGPLLDLQGRVHGLLTLKSLKTENLGFAIAVNALKPLLAKPNPIQMNRWLTIGAIDPAEWTVLPGGHWRQRAGQISVEGRAPGFGRALCLSTEATPEVPFEVGVQVKFTPGDGAAGLVFHADGGDKHYGFYPTNGGLRLTRFDGPDVSNWAILRDIRTPHLRKDGWNSLKVRVEAERVLCFLNGELVVESKDAVYQRGHVGLCKFRHTAAEFKSFRIAKDLTEPKPSDVLQERIAKLTLDPALKDSSLVTATSDLAKEDAIVIEALEQQAKLLEARANSIRRLANDIHVKQTVDELVAAIQRDSNDLLLPALLISRLDNPELNITEYVKEIERQARHVKQRVSESASEDDRLTALNQYLFEEQGFHGSRTDYSHRSNSYLNEVLDDREGLPITLSVLYIEIAKRLGLNVVGVGMPGHFLVRHEPKIGTTQLIDVFARGKKLSIEEARQVFENGTDDAWKESYLDASVPSAILVRMLRNLFAFAGETNDAERGLRYLEAILVLSPESSRDHFLRGVLCYQTQRWQQAQAEVDWLTSHPSDINPKEIDRLAQSIESEKQK